jgi:hypothetical protein
MSITDEEIATIELLNCNDPFLLKKSPSEFIEMSMINKNGRSKVYNSIKSIPKKDFSYFDNKEQ